jgi:aspartate aminotransferase
MPAVATRFSSIEKSATYAVLDLVRDLRAQGADILDLGGGEPDFDTPEHIADAAVTAIRNGFTHYTPSRGAPELLAAIAGKLARDNGVPVDPATDVIVTPSAKHALYSAVTTGARVPTFRLLRCTVSDWMNFRKSRPVALYFE